MPENVCPVIPRVPRDAVWRVDFHRHDLADLAALDEDHSTADTAALAASVLATPDVVCNERIVVGDVGSGNDVSALHEEPDVIGKRLGFHMCATVLTSGLGRSKKGGSSTQPGEHFAGHWRVPA